MTRDRGECDRCGHPRGDACRSVNTVEAGRLQAQVRTSNPNPNLNPNPDRPTRADRNPDPNPNNPTRHPDPLMDPDGTLYNQWIMQQPVEWRWRAQQRAEAHDLRVPTFDVTEDGS